MTTTFVRFKDGTTALRSNLHGAVRRAPPTAWPSRGASLLVSCEGTSTIRRLDKNTGSVWESNGTLSALGYPPRRPRPRRPRVRPGDVPQGWRREDLFTDALWSRRGGNGVVALEFPAFTCGLPSNSVVFWAGCLFPARRGARGPAGRPAQFPSRPASTPDGNVIDSDGDGLPDCWETHGGIDFDGDGVVDLGLCVQVDTNGDGVTNTTECADPNAQRPLRRDRLHAGSQARPQGLEPDAEPGDARQQRAVGVKSVREAFAAAPVAL